MQCDSPACPSECANNYAGCILFHFCVSKPRLTSTFLSIQSWPPFPVHLTRLTCGRFIQREPWLNILNMGSTALCEYSTGLRAANFQENSQFLFAVLHQLPLTPLHVKCSPIEISGGLSNFLHRSPISRFYCTAPLQRNTTWETFLNGIKSHSHKSRWSPLRSYRGA